MYEGYAPMQPLVVSPTGVPQFKPNEVVRTLLNATRNGMQLTLEDLDFGQFAPEDVEQFFMLLGYSVEGFVQLTHIRRDTIDLVYLRANKALKAQRRNERPMA